MEKSLYGRFTAMIYSKLKKHFQKNTDLTAFGLFMGTLMLMFAKILLLPFKIRNLLYAFLLEIREQAASGSLLLLVTLLCIIATLMT